MGSIPKIFFPGARDGQGQCYRAYSRSANWPKIFGENDQVRIPPTGPEIRQLADFSPLPSQNSANWPEFRQLAKNSW